MRLTRIEFNGYKRLAQTSCNVDGKLIAFVGPNEAGKSSVLEALAWLDAPDGTPLPPGVLTYGHSAPDEPIVTATCRVTAADLEGGKTRGKAVSDWCKANKIGAPGKTVIASRLVNNPDQIELTPSATDYLKELHTRLAEILKPWGEADSEDTNTTTGS